MAKFPEADMRRFRNVFVCKRCKSKIKAPNTKITDGKINCRRCGTGSFRSVRKK